MSLYTLHPNLHSSIHKSSIFRTIKKKNRNMVMASYHCRNLFVSTAVLLLLLLLFAASSSSRPDPSLPLASQYQVVEEADKVVGMEEESCEGVGEDECLMRRTLAAHIDYIYTQKHKH